jgi:hypothetical protein
MENIAFVFSTLSRNSSSSLVVYTDDVVLSTVIQFHFEDARSYIVPSLNLGWWLSEAEP